MGAEGREPGSNGGGRFTGSRRRGGGRRDTQGGGSWEKQEMNFATLSQYFAIGKVRGGGSRYGRGRELGVQGAGGGLFRPSCPPPHPQQYYLSLEQNGTVP